MKFRVIDDWLKYSFRWLGKLVGRHPVIFLLVPLLLSLICSLGMLEMEYNTDQDYLMTPVNGDAKIEQALANKFFPTNFSDYEESRSFEFGLYGYVMVTAKDGGSILQPQIWSEIKKLQSVIVGVTVSVEGTNYSYQDLCAKWSGECYTNNLLTFGDTFAVFSDGVLARSVKQYVRNYGDKFRFETANNISKLAEITSKEIIDGVEKIQVLTNSTREIIKKNLDVLSTAVDGLDDLTKNITSQYKANVVESFSAFNLPAYFGGIRLQNKPIENIDICQLLSFIRRENRSGGMDDDCKNPLEIYSAISDIYQHAESEVLYSNILNKFNRKIKSVLQHLDLKSSAKKFINLVSNVSASVEDFVIQVQDLAADEPSKQIEIDRLLEAEAVLIGGLLESDTYPEIGVAWEDKFLEEIRKVKDDFIHIEISSVVSNSLRYEMVDSVQKIKPILSINTLAVIVFCMLVCCTKEVTTSKPWLGLAGVLSTIFGSAAGFGICVFLGAEFTSFNYGALFILIGIGMDDTFVVLNAWHRTDRKASVEERMAETMAEAGVSILITSATDVISFLLAITAPYPYVKIFCLYTGISLLFVFVWHITFFAACLALSGYTEEQGRSGLTLRKVELEEGSTSYTECMFLRRAKYEVNKSQVEKRRKEKERQDFLVEVVSRILRSYSVRIFVLFVYMFYIAVSVWGILNVIVYFDKTKLINYDSSMKAFVDVEDRLFRDKSFSISVILTGDVNYTDPNTETNIEELLRRLEDSHYINEHLTKSWLKDFQTFTFLNNTDMMELSEENFVKSVHRFYQEQASTSPYRLDVAFNSNISRIVASRFLIQGHNLRNTDDEKSMVLELRKICKEISALGGLQVNVFNSYFPYIDQYLTIWEQSVQCFLLTGVIVVGVSLLLLPDTISALSAIFSIISTLTGCLGFMSLWGIALDGITLINLIMCIGFSVDFSAHFCYNYIEHTYNPNVDKDEVVERTLVCVSKPVLQGALSTLLGVVGMLYAPSYSFIIFFKMVLIVITLGVVHSLFIVPLFFRFILDLVEFVGEFVSSKRLKKSNLEKITVVLGGDGYM